MSVEVRRVGPEAAPEVLAVTAAAFGARPPLDPPADAVHDTVESIAADLALHGGLLATREGRPVGALLFHPVPGALFLRRFGVAPDEQGHGIATALVDAALAAAVGHESLAVLARVELPRTVGFWERHGFVECARRAPYVELRRPLETTYDVPDADAMRELGAAVGRGVTAGDLLVLTGELGAGKTTFTQGLGAGLQVRGDVTSPTFVIARVHPSLVGGPELVHVDAYRLGGLDELDDLDLDTSLDEAVTVVEWGAGLAEALAERRLEITISRTLGAGAPAGPDAGDDPRRVVLRRVVAQ